MTLNLKRRLLVCGMESVIQVYRLDEGESFWLIRAARCDNATREPLSFAAVSFFLSFFFSARSPRSLGLSPQNIAT